MTQTLGLIGFGAFGAFIAPHIAKHLPVVVYDPHKAMGDLHAVASCDIVMLAVPVQQMESVLTAIAPLLKPQALVIDVASVKIKPTALMEKILPDSVAIVGTHPLFGPQSGKDGIAGLNIVVCNVRGARGEEVQAFLRDKLGLKVFVTTPDEHDRQLAYVQGLTHLIAKVIVSLNLPEFQLTTKTFDYMTKMVDMVRYDSDELFKAIERENPFTVEAKDAFFAAARRLEERLASKDEPTRT